MKKFTTLFSAGLIALPVLAAYDINFSPETTISNSSRHLDAIGIDDVMVSVEQGSDRLLYHDLSSTAIFEVTAGEAISPIMEWTGTYMHGYLYADFNSDGVFDAQTELVSFSYYQGVNSYGLSANQDCGVELPPCVVPNVEAGDYRIRFLVDWDYIDPAGRNDSGNSITRNGGAIVDATLRVAAKPVVENPYAINYTAETTITHASRKLYSVALAQDVLGTQTVAVTQADDKLLYFDRTSTEVLAVAGSDMRLTFNWDGGWMNGYFYIDRGNDGEFSAHVSSSGLPVPGSDLIAFSHLNGLTSGGASTNGSVLNEMPTFKVPAELTPGKYRARAKIDWDSADPAGSTTILKDGGAIVDFTLVIPEGEIEVATITAMPLNGMLFSGDGNPLPENHAAGYELEVKAIASLPGFETNHIIVRHGSGDTLADTEILLDSDGRATIPGDILYGDVIIYALFEEQSDSEWTKIWGDEFNSDALDFTTWSYHPRSTATWNRFCAKSNAEGAVVNTFGNGYYNSHCIPTDKAEFPSESEAMISGAIYTSGKFEFHYGRIEARIKTHPFKGNFPAFWLMPATNAEGSWPRSGEIDIWEQIDTSDRAYNTVHTGWTGWKSYCGWTEAPKESSPANSGSVVVDNVYTWHYYALEWDADELRWYVDGVHSFTYKNMHYSEAGTNYTAEICWPFYKDFYVILNQSVGNGSWAQTADTSHSYLTQFDYVRAYQKKGEDTYTSKLKGNGDDPDFYTPIGEGSINGVVAVENVPTEYFDLQGRQILNPGSGIFILRQGNNSKKVIR